MDQWDKIAEAVLPCTLSLEVYPRVAAELRAAYQAGVKSNWDEAEHYRIEASNVYLANENLQEENAKLKGEMEIGLNPGGEAAAYLKGLEAAREAVMKRFRDMNYDITMNDIREPIQLLIDEARGGKPE